jgi:hypothetical protein
MINKPATPPITGYTMTSGGGPSASAHAQAGQDEWTETFHTQHGYVTVHDDVDTHQFSSRAQALQYFQRLNQQLEHSFGQPASSALALNGGDAAASGQGSSAVASDGGEATAFGKHAKAGADGRGAVAYATGYNSQADAATDGTGNALAIGRNGGKATAEAADDSTATAGAAGKGALGDAVAADDSRAIAQSNGALATAASYHQGQAAAHASGAGSSAQSSAYNGASTSSNAAGSSAVDLSSYGAKSNAYGNGSNGSSIHALVSGGSTLSATASASELRGLGASPYADVKDGSRVSVNERNGSAAGINVDATRLGLQLDNAGARVQATDSRLFASKKDGALDLRST